MSRISNVIKNAKVGLFFMVITFALGMFSRKIFLDELGPEFIGLTTTLLGIIGFLSLAEMGLSVAVSSTLYKPLAEKNYELVNTTIDFLGKAYKAIGLGMVVLGLIVALFIPYFFPEQEVELSVIYYAYVVFLTSVIIEYIFNYRQIILSADQKYYILTCCRDGLNIFKVVIQMAAIEMGMGYYAWLIVGLITTIISIVIINIIINRKYTWLTATGKSFSTLYHESGEVVSKSKQLIIHKVGGIVFSASDNILIYKFTNLTMVSFVGNYLALSSIIQTAVNTLKTGFTASVGNFVSERTSTESRVLFENVFYAHLIIAISSGILFFELSDSFVTMWLGSEYIIGISVKTLISMNIIILVLRGCIDAFINAYGLFMDTKAPIVELFINISISVVFGYEYGVSGVLFGTFVSVFFVIILWKPYLIYKLKFNVSYFYYIKLLLVYCFPILLFSLLCCFLFKAEDVESWFEFLILSFYMAPLIVCIFFVSTFINASFRFFLLEKAKFILLRYKRF